VGRAYPAHPAGRGQEDGGSLHQSDPDPRPRSQDPEFLTTPPVSAPGFKLPKLVAFLHQELRPVPGVPYAINLIKTIQPVEHGADHMPLILDIDVFLERPLRLADPAESGHLSKMRWLKNKTFFTNVTPKAIDRFK